MLLKLTLKSIFSRKLTSVLLLLSIMLSTVLLLTVQKIRLSVKQSVAQSISGTDLIVGARTGDVQLLLFTVFKQGQLSHNMSMKSVDQIKSLSQVKWVVPISLGDYHKGFPVLASTPNYFKYYKYANKKTLSFKDGRSFKNNYEVVIGYKIAKRLGYQLNDLIYLSHTKQASAKSIHKNHPFKIVGILNPTASPVDKTLHISLRDMQMIHLPKDEQMKKNLQVNPISVSACLIGLKSKFALFNIQQYIQNQFPEALSAIIPGLVLSKLWENFSAFETGFLWVCIVVIVLTFVGLLCSLLLSLQYRKYELLTLRLLGARPYQLCLSLLLEAFIISLTAVMFALVLMLLFHVWLQPILESKTGLLLHLNQLNMTDIKLLISMILLTCLISLIPAFLLYKNAKMQGLNSQ